MSAQKFHVNKNTGDHGPCRATVRGCPLGGDAVHFETQEEAEKHAGQVLEKLHGVGGLDSKDEGEGIVINGKKYDSIADHAAQYNAERRKKSKRTTARNNDLTENEQKVVDGFSSSIKNVISARAQNNDLAFQDAHTQEWAKKRFFGAVDYAKKQQDEHLLAKLKDARIVDSGSFKTAEGKNVSTDKIIEQKSKLNDLQEKQGRIRTELKDLVAEAHARGENLSGIKFDPVKFTDDGKGKVSLSVSEDVNMDEYNKLPKSVQSEVSTEITSYSVEKAREVLSAAKIHKITNRVQNINYFMGKPKDISNNTAQVAKKSEGTVKERMATRQQDMATLYKSFRENNGMSKKQMEAEHNAATEAAKQAATATQSQGSVFLPARSAKNGALISNSYVIDAKEAKERLTDSELKKISTTSIRPSITKAKEALKNGKLSKSQYDNIFSNYKVNLRVYDN